MNRWENQVFDWLPERARKPAKRILLLAVAGLALIGVFLFLSELFPQSATWAGGNLLFSIGESGAVLIFIAALAMLLYWFAGTIRSDW